MNFLMIFFFFVIGLVIGSFLNVVIYRFNTSRFLKGRSACVVCQNKLSWYELIPVVSFCLLRGRCRSCKSRISKTYLLVELITGFIFLGLFLKFQDLFLMTPWVFLANYVFYSVAFSVMVVIAFYDFKHKIIPDRLVIILGLWSFSGLFIFNESKLLLHLPTSLQFFSGILVALPFAFLWLVSRGTWMGLGDAKLVLGMGWLVGLACIVSGVAISFWLGALFGIFLILFSRKYKMKSEIPFAPFLIFGTILVFLLDLYVFPIF